MAHSRIRRIEPSAPPKTASQQSSSAASKSSSGRLEPVAAACADMAEFNRHCALVHEATWHKEVLDVPYIAATTEELEVMVNYLTTLWGKLKERVRPIVGPSRGFNQCVATQQDIQDNLDLFHELHPNSFHCTSTRPRQGCYEHIDLAHCIAAAFFYSPNAVRVLFPDYFEDMPLTIVAFVLAIRSVVYCLGMVD
ncbi:hypothetical protein FRC10_004332 [Ceratobasidium sp. 414]|nr:hypothetical protein FRC10_004332 [Ceratobasidium sp. 414]